MKYARIVMAALLAALVTLFAVLSFQNSVIVTSVGIHLKDGVTEHRDPSVLRLGREHQLPDYKVKLHVTRRLLGIDLGTKLNTSATNWIDFPINDVVPLRKVQEVLVLEDDKVANDILDRFPVVQGVADGKSFQCRFGVTHSFEAGMNWFFDTPIGKSIAIGIMLLVILIPLSLLKHFLRN